jgi:poly(A) polymerase
VGEELGGQRVHVYEAFGTAAIRLPEGDPHGALVLEFVAARRESYRGDSRKPEVEAGTLEEDQARRDFTVNALAVALNAERFGNLLDPFGGIIDLVSKKLRTPLDPRRTFEDDPLRMIRPRGSPPSSGSSSIRMPAPPSARRPPASRSSAWSA